MNKADQTTSDLTPITNNFCMTICTVNGSGSATANGTLFRALFKMGIPTSGKNVFPSNIKGMATWYVIRTSVKGYTGRLPYDDIVVAMNPATFLEDLTYLPQGGVIFYADHITIPEGTRSDLIFYPMPIKELTKQLDPPRALRDFTENMLYVGIVSQVLGIPKDALRYGVEKHFPNKQTVIDSNMRTIELSYDWAEKILKNEIVLVLRKCPR